MLLPKKMLKRRYDTYRCCVLGPVFFFLCVLCFLFDHVFFMLCFCFVHLDSLSLSLVTYGVLWEGVVVGRLR